MFANKDKVRKAGRADIKMNKVQRWWLWSWRWFFSGNDRTSEKEVRVKCSGQGLAFCVDVKEISENEKNGALSVSSTKGCSEIVWREDEIVCDKI